MRSVIKSGAKLLKEKIEEFDTIVIFRHQSPDFDAFGSQLGLKTWILDNYPNKKVYAVGNNHVVFTHSIYPEMDIVDLNERDVNGKPIFTAEKVMKEMAQLSKVHEQLTALEAQVKQERQSIVITRVFRNRRFSS